MYKFTYSEEKNRIYIYVEGALSQIEVQNYINELIALIEEKTKPGFTVLADSSRGAISFLENSPKFQVIRDYGVEKGFKNCSTVVSEEVYIIHQENPFPGIQNTYKTIEEALEFLDSLP